MPDLPTKAQWDDPDYEWPVTAIPGAEVVETMGKTTIALGGRVIKEAHADRGVVMEFPNPGIPDTKIRKQVPRCECRRRAQVMVPLPPDDAPAPGTPPRDNNTPMKVCVVDDGVHLWPRLADILA